MKTGKYTIKLICLDLDGTLLTSSGFIDDYTLETLNNLYDKGYIIAIISGRPLKAINQITSKLKHHWDIGMNGQQIYNIAKNELKTKAMLDALDLSKIYAESSNYPLICNIHDDNQAAICFPKKFRLYAILYNFIEQFRWIGKQKRNTKKYYFNDIKDTKIKNVGKICFAGQQKYIQKLTNLLITKYPEYNCVRVGLNWLEVMDKSISKGNAINYLIDYYHLKKENVLAFGDGENDISMFEASGYSCAMANAMDSVKLKACETIGSNNKKGIGIFLNKFLREEEK